MPRIVYPDAGENLDEELSEASRRKLIALGGLVVHYGRPESDEAYVRRVDDAQAILLGWDLPAEVMRAAPALELVVFTGIGAARFVDLPKAAAKGITVCNCPGYSDNTVAEHALALLLAVARHLPRLDADLRAGRWNQASMGMELKGRRLGLDNVVLSPHVAYNTPEAAIALHDIAVECLVRYFEGEPMNVVAGPA